MFVGSLCTSHEVCRAPALSLTHKTPSLNALVSPGKICLQPVYLPLCSVPVSDTTLPTLTTFSNGYLGSRDDEERSEMRYVMRIAERESSSL